MSPPAGGASQCCQTNTSCKYQSWSQDLNPAGPEGFCGCVGVTSLCCCPRFLCCTGEADLWDWITCFLRAQVRLSHLITQLCHVTAEDSVLGRLQNDDPVPPVLRRHSSSDISKQKFGTMPLVPIRGDESNSSMLSANQTLVSRT